MRSFVFSLLVLLTFPGCSVLTPKTPEEIVAHRAQKRIDLLMSGDYEASYEFATPGYRTTEGAGRYGTRWSGVGMWLSAVVTRVDCGGTVETDRCEATVKVNYKAARFEPTETYLKEDWLLIDGNWYLYQNFGE